MIGGKLQGRIDRDGVDRRITATGQDVFVSLATQQSLRYGRSCGGIRRVKKRDGFFKLAFGTDKNT